jgi:hypothetical protein
MIEDRKETKPTGCMHYEQLNGFGEGGCCHESHQASTNSLGQLILDKKSNAQMVSY